MKISTILNDLIVLAESAGYKIIRDKGKFRGGACLVHQEKVIVLNKRLPPESAITSLARALVDIVELSKVKQPIREVIEREKEK